MKTKIFLLLIFSVVTVYSSFGQDNRKKKITGYVVDQSQRPVVGAVIMIDDEKTDHVTDNKGYYKVRVKSGASKIGVYMGSNDMIEEPINGRARINFTFTGTLSNVKKTPVDSPGEEEINIGYGTVKKKNLISPVSKLDGRNNRYAAYNNIFDMIRGELAGVQVVGRSITIQGATSILASTEPLFVVDGIITNSIDDISPQMVKSIEVLKGSAASIYGTRGANGVILINLIGAKDVK